jgi:MFS family permease
LAAGTVQIATELETSLTDIALLSGYLLLAAGAAGPFISALARKYGKRPLYIFSSLMGLVGCIVGQCATSYTVLLAARIIQGFAQPAYESLIMASVGDMFFVHERGSRVAGVMFILTAINNGVSIIAGPITAHLGWHYNFHILLPFTAIQLILLVLFCPETTYQRDQIYNTDIVVMEQGLQKPADIEEKAHRQIEEQAKSSNGLTNLEQVQSSASRMRARKSFVKRLALYDGSFVKDSIFKMLLAGPTIFLNVGALYNILVSGLVITWAVATSIISALLWTVPPYSLTAAGVGYVSIGPLIGGSLGAVLYGAVSDPIMRYMTRKNKGTYEPEFRLVLMAIAGIPTVAGLIGFGYACQNTVSIYLVSFTWGVMMLGLFTVAAATGGYALDAFRAHSTEIFVMNMAFKNFFFYG